MLRPVRLALVLALLGSVAACSSTTAPQVTPDDSEDCRSGWIIASGRTCP